MALSTSATAGDAPLPTAPARMPSPTRPWPTTPAGMRPPTVTPVDMVPQPVLHGTIMPSLLDEPMLELELSLADFDPELGFAEGVKQAAETRGGDFLFDLPASGLMPDCARIAAVRLPSENGCLTVFACLEPDLRTIRIEAPDDQTSHLHSFAGAFVHLLERF